MMKSLHWLLWLLFMGILGCQAYEVPEATINVIYPQGIEVSLPQDPGTTLFAFHGKLNEPMLHLGDQTWAADITEPRNGHWIYRNFDIKLERGDVLYYWTTIRYNGLDYYNYNRSFVYPKIEQEQEQLDNPTTIPSVTSQSIRHESDLWRMAIIFMGGILANY